MDPFGRSEQYQEGCKASDRLLAFHKAMWDGLVPKSGECASVQGELVRVIERLMSELLREGMGNYYTPDDDGDGFADGFYPKMAAFLLDTLAANRGGALDADDVAAFAGARALLEADWNTQQKIDAIVWKEEEEGELSDVERKDLEQLEASHDAPDWGSLLDRAHRCVANWCIANPELIDGDGTPVVENGLADVRHVLDPPPPPPVCSICNGRGWVPAADPSSFPEMCACKRGLHAIN
jgi:hypothetical protein